MTAIAYDAKNKTLAVDSLFTAGGRKTYGTKYRLLADGRVVVVFAGGVVQGLKALDNLAAGKPITHEQIENVTIVAMYLRGRRKGTVLVYEDSPTPTRHRGFGAWGSGSDVAIGALSAGASAEDAVKIAIKHHAECGGKVHVFTPE